jgi:hypothetical protein
VDDFGLAGFDPLLRHHILPPDLTEVLAWKDTAMQSRDPDRAFASAIRRALSGTAGGATFARLLGR